MYSINIYTIQHNIKFQSLNYFSLKMISEESTNQTITFTRRNKKDVGGSNKQVYMSENYIILVDDNKNMIGQMDDHRGMGYYELCQKFQWLPNRPIAFCKYKDRVYTLYNKCFIQQRDKLGEHDMKRFINTYLDVLIEIILQNLSGHTYFDIKLQNIGVDCKLSDKNTYTSLIDLDSIDINAYTPLSENIREYLNDVQTNGNDYLNDIMSPILLDTIGKMHVDIITMKGVIPNLIDYVLEKKKKNDIMIGQVINML